MAKSILQLKRTLPEPVNDYDNDICYGREDSEELEAAAVFYDNWLESIYKEIAEQDTQDNIGDDEIDYDDPAWDLQIYQFVSRQFTAEQFDMLCESVYYRTWAYA